MGSALVTGFVSFEATQMAVTGNHFFSSFELPLAV
jgi:hypothetical protein